MNAPDAPELVLRFGPNARGRDFFVGDLHGMYPALERLLAEADFDAAADRVFALGDLTDRGPHSARHGEFLAQPWFHSIRGNHEELALAASRAVLTRDPRAGLALMEWEANGGGWATAQFPANLALFATLERTLGALPYLIEVDTPQGRVGLVHAEVPVGLHWDELVTRLPGDAALRDGIVWSRARLRTQDATPVPGIAWALSGHTPLVTAQRLGNHWFLDTGACYVQAPSAALTALVPAAQGWQVYTLATHTAAAP